MADGDSVWVFNGARSNFPSGIFRSLDHAERWIEQHRLTGTPTLYPLDTGVYDWTLDEGYFSPTQPSQTTSEFIGRFTSVSMEHHHHEDGQR